MVATIGLLKLPDVSRSSKLLYLHSSYLGICFQKIEALANLLPHCIFETQSLEYYMGLRKMQVKRFPSDIICVPGVFLESITLDYLEYGVSPLTLEVGTIFAIL